MLWEIPLELVVLRYVYSHREPSSSYKSLRVVLDNKAVQYSSKSLSRILAWNSGCL